MSNLLKIKEKYLWFIGTKYYIALVGFLCFLGWFLKIEPVVLSIFVLMSIAMFAFSKDTTPIIPIIISALFITRGSLSFDKIPVWLIVLPALLVISIIFYLVKNKPKFYLTKLAIAFLAVTFISSLSIINIDYNVVEPIMTFLVFSGLIYCFVYIFFSITETRDDALEYLAFTMMVFGLVISFEIFASYVTYFIEHGEVKTLIDLNLDLGWGIENDACIYINVSLCFAGYLVNKLKQFYLPLIAIAIDAFAILITGSRGGIAGFGLMMIGILVLIYMYSKNRKKTLIIYGVMFGVCLLGALIMIKPILLSFERIFNVGFSLTGRDSLYDLAITNFKKHPIVGSSIFAGIDENNRLVVYHSFIYQTLGSFGVLGMLGLIGVMVIEYWLIIKSKSDFKWFFFVLITVSMLHGLIDNVFYMIIYMIITSITFALFENSEKNKVIEKEKSNSIEENSKIEENKTI